MTADPSPEPRTDREVIVLGGGCFWCTEAVFSELRGVDRVVPGYAGGTKAHPSYEEVCGGETGHAEVVEVTFDPTRVPLRDLLRIFFTVHDPTTLNRQGNDVGTQYRSVIFARNAEQRKVAEEVVREIEAAKLWRGRIVTDIAGNAPFYPAEEYHRHYFRLHPERAYCQLVIAPKVAKFRSHFADRLRAA